MSDRISVAELRRLFMGEEEFAVIDPREEGLFTRGHLLAASNLPLSRLELLIDRAVPRQQVQILLCDDGDGSAAQAASVLAARGYDKVQTLDGGIAAWSLSGGALFSGLNVPGKAFGEFVEKTCNTPSISARALRQRLDEGRPTLLLDTRTPREHRSFCIPGAQSCPGAELVYRAQGASPGSDGMIVTHCAGRTRSIIGAQTLIDAGATVPVMALENGTMAWIFEGYLLEKGADRPLARPDETGHAAARSAAAAVAERHGVVPVSRDQVARWQDRADARTLYLIDVRSEEEYAQGHWPTARQVTGGQLVQNADSYLVTRGARIILVDSDAVRAPMTGAWLKQMGWQEVYAARMDPNEAGLVSPTAAPRPDLETIDAGALSGLIAQGAAVVADLRDSVAYRRGHVPGAVFLTRADLDRDLEQVPERELTVLVAEDLDYAALMAGDLERAGRRVRLLDGGLTAWSDAGLPVAGGLERMASAPNDRHLDPGDFDSRAEVLRECRRYLDWEIALVHQIAGDPAAPYAT